MLTSGLIVGRLGGDSAEAIADPIGPHYLPGDGRVWYLRTPPIAPRGKVGPHIR
jgi:hypothetical protein